MELRGYMLEVTFDGETLTARGTNKAAQTALLGERRNEPALVLPKSQIASVELKPANPLVNGRVTIGAADGAKYVLHFRRKSNDEFAQLASALQS